MTTLNEIETVVDQLSLGEQEELLRHLEASLLRRRAATTPASREDWMRRLDGLRSSIASGTSTLTSEQIMAELREE